MRSGSLVFLIVVCYLVIGSAYAQDNKKISFLNRTDVQQSENSTKRDFNKDNTKLVCKSADGMKDCGSCSPCESSTSDCRCN